MGYDPSPKLVQAIGWSIVIVAALGAMEYLSDGMISGLFKELSDSTTSPREWLGERTADGVMRNLPETKVPLR